MATLLSVYTRLLAGVSAALAVLWGILAMASPGHLGQMFGSEILVWGPALWFLYLALRLGGPRSVARFYAGSLRPFGHAKILIFGLLAVGTLAVGAVVGLIIAMPALAADIGNWGPIAALVIATFYLVIAHFGARPLAFSTGQVRYDGEPVLNPGKLPREVMRFPYRG